MAQELNPVGPATPALEGGERISARPLLIPATDIQETPDALIVSVDMPGIPPDAVDITLERRLLTIRAHGRDHQPPGYRQVYREYINGDYERVFTLAEDIDRERIAATHKDGVLHLVLPKAEAAKARKIELKAG